MQKTAHTIFAEGDKNGKLLAMLVADYHPVANITVIKDRGGTLVTDPQLIMQGFVAFFSSLYSPIPTYNESALDSLLGELSIPKITEQASLLLDAVITAKEIQKAIFAFHPNKAPGPDGFPADFYKSNVELLAPRLNLLLEHCLESGTLPDSMLEAYMVLLLKLGKDPAECASYHPIALLNMDLKILTKVLAFRLANVFQSLVNIDLGQNLFRFYAGKIYRHEPEETLHPLTAPPNGLQD